MEPKVGASEIPVKPYKNNISPEIGPGSYHHAKSG